MIKFRLNIFLQLINLIVRLLFVYLLFVRGCRVIIVIKEVIFIIMPPLVLYGLKIKSL